MSINKFATENFSRKYTSLDVNTKSITARRYEKYNDVFPTISNVSFTDDFEDNSFDYTVRGTYLDNFCKLDIFFSGVRVSGSSGTGKIEFRANNVGNSVTATVNTSSITGIGKFNINGSDLFNITNVETFYETSPGISYWKFRVTFESSRAPPGLSSLDNFGFITLFYNRLTI